MLITTARHDREIAAKDAEIAGLMKRLTDAEATNTRLRQSEHSWKSNYRATLDVNAALRAENAGLRNDVRQAEASSDRLTARLAVFTAPRERDARGHFLPAKGRTA